MVHPRPRTITGGGEKRHPPAQTWFSGSNAHSAVSPHAASTMTGMSEKQPSPL